MTMPFSSDAPAGWRPACASDLPTIVRLAASIHPAYPERAEVFADRLAVHPSGVLLARIGGDPVGYAIGHPWRGSCPLLDRCLVALPEAPDSYWIHDVALLPAARGAGLGRALLWALHADAVRRGLHPLRLVAVGRARSFWSAAGFVATAEPLPDCYGAGAVAMLRDAGGAPDREASGQL